MSDGYDPAGSNPTEPVIHHGGWHINSSPGSSSQASSRPPSSSTFEDEEDAESLIAIPPNIPVYDFKRHITGGNPTPKPDSVKQLGSWRGKDNKLKTAHAALVLCLNIGVDPPDVVKTNPCAVLECWIDPFSMPPSKALEAIGKNLVHQFETLNPRMRYKQYPDPSVDDTRRNCQNLRKLVKDERALFYYNGHGVPKPTASGEIWVFNRTYTQYIPVSLHDLQAWLGSPTIYVWDCSAAGHILDNFERFARKRDQEFYTQHPDDASRENYAPFLESIHLAACGADEVLPMSPDLPADVFTSALTSPIEMALRFHVLQNQHRLKVTVDEAMKIPGDLKDRRTPLGELYWIFTAVTDTIAWTTFPKDIFKKLFRQDWTLAALFRNFLLAERIMRKYNCTPRAYPVLPATHMHQMWLSWDLAVDKVMIQIPNLLEQQRSIPAGMDQTAVPPWQYEQVASVFFEEHLQAFLVWLNRGGSNLTKRGPLAPDPGNLPAMTPPPLNEEDVVTQSPADVIATTTGRSKPSSRASREKSLVPRKPPDQLPILLQVLLSQTHRLRALILLGNFIDLGPWAVHLALTIGIFPYVQKLLQSPAAELRPVLVYIWTRIIAFDQSVQADLLKDNGYQYFANLLKHDVILSIPNELEHKAMCAFILAMVCRDHTLGQQACVQAGLFVNCTAGLTSPDFLMRQFSALALGMLWDGFDEAKTQAVEVLRIHELMDSLLLDDAVEVRAAIFFALSTLFGASASTDPEKRGGGGMGPLLGFPERNHLGFELKLGMSAIMVGKEDASPMVRKEVLVLFSALVFEYRGWFVVAAWAYWEGSRSYFKQLCAATSRAWRRAGSTADSGRGRLDESDSDMVMQAIEEWVNRLDPSLSEVEQESIKTHNHVIISSVFILYATLLELTLDPYPEVANMARTVADYVMALLKASPFSRLHASTLHITPSSDVPPGVGTALTSSQIRLNAARPSSPASSRDPSIRSTLQSTDGVMSSTLKRTTSIASSIRNIAAGYAFPSLGDKDGHPNEAEDEFADEHAGLNGTTGAPQEPHPPRFEYKATIPEPRMYVTHYAPPYKIKPGATGAHSDSEQNGLRSSATSTRSYRGSTTGDRRSIASSSALSAPPTPARRHSTFHVPSSGRQTPSSIAESSSEMSGSSSGFRPAEIVEALIEEDWERLRLRRNAGQHAQEQRQRALLQQQQQQRAQQGQSGRLQQLPQQGLSHLAQQHPPGQHPNAVGATATPVYGRAGPSNGRGVSSHQPSPLSQVNGMNSSWTSDSGSSFVTTDSDGSSSNTLGALRTGHGLAHVLPLKSKFFDWSMEYFVEPQMRAAENEEPGSVVYNEQSWRGQRNESLVNETGRQALIASRCLWDKSLITLQNTHPVRLLKFHQFETQLATSNNDRLVSVWDWAKRRRLACFDNGNPEGTSVTSLQFINEENQTQLLTASADGMVKIYSNYDPETSFEDYPLELTTSFRALPRLSFSEYRSGVITEWLQPYGLLITGGDSRIIKFWDAHKETCALDLNTESDSCVTSIASDLDGAATLITGAGDGVLSVYDRRMRGVGMRFKAFQKHGTWIESVHWQRGGEREMLSGSLDGKVVLWDIRAPHGAVMEWEPHTNGLANLAMHHQARVFASSSSLKGNHRQQIVTVQSLPPLRTPVVTHLKIPINTPPHLANNLSHGFFPSPGSLTFHPHEMVIGWGSYDGRIKLYGCNLKEPVVPESPEPKLPTNVLFGDAVPSIAGTNDSLG